MERKHFSSASVEENVTASQSQMKPSIGTLRTGWTRLQSVQRATVNSAIELHDSECLAVEVDTGGKGFVLLDAYVHRSQGRPGWEDGEGGIQRIRVIFEAMLIEGMVGDLPAYICEGSLTAGSAVFDNLIDLPASYAGKACLKLMLSDDARVLIVSGENPTLLPESDFRYVEPVPWAITQV